MKVARRYKFHAEHSLPGIAGYDETHDHVYTVEVVLSGAKGEGGMILDTAALDQVADAIFHNLEGQDLNTIFAFPTTVENLAEHFADRFGNPAQVTVWEDDDRWGQAP